MLTETFLFAEHSQGPDANNLMWSLPQCCERCDLSVPFWPGFTLWHDENRVDLLLEVPGVFPNGGGDLCNLTERQGALAGLTIMDKKFRR